VQLSPGLYPVSSFVYYISNIWNFQRCEACSSGNVNGLVEIEVLLPDTPSANFTFQEINLTELLIFRSVLNFNSVTIQPAQLMNQKDGGNLVFNSTIFSVTNGGLTIKDCTIRNFTIESGNDDVNPPTLISSTIGPFEIQSSLFINNTYIGDENSINSVVQGFFGSATQATVVESKFIGNRFLDAYLIEGGIFNCIMSCTFINNVFQDNFGSITYAGNGLVLHFGGTAKSILVVTNCIFSNNRIESLVTERGGEGVDQYALATAGAISIHSSSFTLVNISNCSFDSHTADQGGAIAVYPSYQFDRSASEYNSGNISVWNSTFSNNLAHSGLGSAIFILGMDIYSFAMTNCTLISNKGPHMGFIEFPGLVHFGDAIEPSAIFLYLCSEVNMMGLTFFGDPSSLANDNSIFSRNIDSTLFAFSNLPFGSRTNIEAKEQSYIELHNIYFSKCRTISVSEIDYFEVVPTSGLLHARSTRNSLLFENIRVHKLTTVIPSQNSLWLLVTIDGIPDAIEFEAHHFISGFYLLDWPFGAGTTVFMLRHISHIDINNLHMANVSSDGLPVMVASVVISALHITN
jgi:hypothetical protein